MLLDELSGFIFQPPGRSQRQQGGSISAKINWLYFGEKPLDSFRRKTSGSNSVKNRWTHFGENQLAPYHRKMTYEPKSNVRSEFHGYLSQSGAC